MKKIQHIFVLGIVSEQKSAIQLFQSDTFAVYRPDKTQFFFPRKQRLYKFGPFLIDSHWYGLFLSKRIIFFFKLEFSVSKYSKPRQNMSNNSLNLLTKAVDNRRFLNNCFFDWDRDYNPNNTNSLDIDYALVLLILSFSYDND